MKNIKNNHQEDLNMDTKYQMSKGVHALILPYPYFRTLIDQEDTQQIIMGAKNMKIKVSCTRKLTQGCEST